MKHRYSFQRELILDELQSSLKKHLSAEELFSKVKKRHKSIGLGTIYRNLGMLETMQKVKKLTISHGKVDKALYEVAAKPHHHVICRICNKIEDFYEIPPSPTCKAGIEKMTGFKIENALINAFGLCEDCQD